MSTIETNNISVLQQNNNFREIINIIISQIDGIQTNLNNPFHIVDNHIEPKKYIDSNSNTDINTK